MIQGVVEKFQKKYFKNDASKMGCFHANWERSKAAKANLFDLLGGEEVKVTVEIDNQMKARPQGRAERAKLGH